MLDGHGNPINKRNAFVTRSVVYVHLIPPGAADTVHFRLQVPEDCGQQITLEAKLNYRKFAWWNTQWAYAGVRDPEDTDYRGTGARRRPLGLHRRHRRVSPGKIKDIPDIPITVISKTGRRRASCRRARPSRTVESRSTPGAGALERLRHRLPAPGRPGGPKPPSRRSPRSTRRTPTAG